MPGGTNRLQRCKNVGIVQRLSRKIFPVILVGALVSSTVDLLPLVWARCSSPFLRSSPGIVRKIERISCAYRIVVRGTPPDARKS